MKSKICLGLVAFSNFCSNVHADTSYDITKLITKDQMDTIVTTLVRASPDAAKYNAKASDIVYRGYVTLDSRNYLTTIDMNAVQYKVTAKFTIFPVTSTVTMSIAATLPDLDCNNPIVTRVSVTGTNSLIDDEIRKFMEKNAKSIIRDNYIVQSNLIKYCKVKPVVQ